MINASRSVCHGPPWNWYEKTNPMPVRSTPMLALLSPRYHPPRSSPFADELICPLKTVGISRLVNEFDVMELARGFPEQPLVKADERGPLLTHCIFLEQLVTQSRWLLGRPRRKGGSRRRRPAKALMSSTKVGRTDKTGWVRPTRAFFERGLTETNHVVF